MNEKGLSFVSMRNVRWREPTLENHCRFPFLLLLYCFVALTFPRLSTSTRVHRPRRVRFTISRDRGVATFSTDNLSNANLHLFFIQMSRSMSIRSLLLLRLPIQSRTSMGKESWFFLIFCFRSEKLEKFYQVFFLFSRNNIFLYVWSRGKEEDGLFCLVIFSWKGKKKIAKLLFSNVSWI